MKYLSLFSGIEAASVAWHGLGWTPEAFSEIEPFPCAVLAHRFPGIPNVGDMTQVDWTKFRGKVDMVCGGPPCQDFSVAGKGASLQGARGKLSVEYAKAIHAVRPTWCLTENVPGWLSKKDNAFGHFLGELSGADAPLVSGREDGKWDRAGVVSGPVYGLAWRVLDAQHFGVPQRRKRVFVVGYLGDWRPAAEVLFEPESLRRDSAEGGEAGEDVAGTISSRNKGGGGLGTDFDLDGGLQLYNDEGSEGAIMTKSNLGKGVNNRTPLVVHSLRGEGFDASEDGTGGGVPLVPIAFYPTNRQPEFGNYEDQFPAIKVGSGGQCGNPPAVVYDMRGNGDGKTVPTLTKEAAGDRPSDYAAMVFMAGQGAKAGSIAASTTVSPTIKGASSGLNQAPSVHAGTAVRRLTPTECERLQGFPDGWTQAPYRKKPAADGPRYKSIGNSWAVPCARWIGKRIDEWELRNVLGDLL